MGTPNPLEDRPLILFDGVCNLCNGSVQFIIRHDPLGYFKYASLQSAAGQHHLHKFNLPVSQIHSVILIKGEKMFQKSDAALEIVRNLNGLWPALSIFKIIPLVLRDWLYDVVARNRYVWFGKKDSCMIPTPELKSRFIE